MMRLGRVVLPVVLAAVVIGGCDDSPVGSDPPLRLLLTPDLAVVLRSDGWTNDVFRVRLVRGAEEYDLSDSTLTWRVDPAGFATIFASDSLWGVAAEAYTDGVRVRVSLGALADSAVLVVSAGPIAAITGVGIQPDPLVMALGDTAQLVVTIARSATIYNVTEPLDSLFSMAPGVVSVGADRRVVAHAHGEAEVRAYRGSRFDRDTIRVPSPPTPLAPVTRVATSGVYSCAIPSVGSDVVCWPKQEAFPRGPGAMEIIAGTAGATHLIADVYAGCVVLASTEGRCWGNSYPVSIAVGAATSPVPFSPVLGGAGYRTLAVGGSNVCGLRTDSTAVCWGQNYLGGAGTGSAADFVGAPETVLGGHKWLAITVGFGFACGIATDSTAYCWGHGGGGKLGNGAEVAAAAPSAVAGGHKAVRITASDFHACLLDDAGAAWCWGEGVSGRLGDGTNSNSNVPTRVAGGHAYVHLAAGNGVTCGITAAGESFCWGAFADMRAGASEYFFWSIPTLAPGTQTYVQLAPALLMMCGLTGPGAVYCWGHNEYGQLGDGTNVARHRPSRVRSP